MRRGCPVLVVEDDRDVREGLLEFLDDEGFIGLSAQDGLEALAQLRLHANVRVVLLDLMMPRMDGRTFRREQLADPQLAPIPVILLSATNDCRRVAIELAVQHFFQKPYRWERLVETLELYC